MKRLVLTVLLGTVGSTGIANAVIAFTSFAPGDVYNTGSGYIIGGPSSSSPQRVAAQFTSLASGPLDTIRFATFYTSGSTSLQLALLNDSGSNLLGSTITAWSFTASSTSAHIVTLTNTAPSIVLTTGTKYWVEVFTSTNGLHAWNIADSSIPMGRLGWSNNNGATYTYGDGLFMSAFEVNVVPEPGSMIALALGGAALLASRRRKV